MPVQARQLKKKKKKKKKKNATLIVLWPKTERLIILSGKKMVQKRRMRNAYRFSAPHLHDEENTIYF